MIDSVNRTMQPRMGETSFRSSMTSKQGHVPGRTAQGKIINVNMKNWTVDVISNFDRYRWFNIQVGTPYSHFSNGEGFFAVPEVGASCMVVLPSDSTAPYVGAFVMPAEKIPDVSAPDAPSGTRSHGNVPQFPTDVTFAGGRPAYTPGTLGMTGRDGQFCILHRGGVLEIGASELAQRLYIPLANHVIDVTQRYSHHNVGGAVLWGMQEGPGQTDFPTTQIQTFRVMANDQFATVRVQRGDVLNPLQPEGGTISDTVVYEVAVIPTGFNADSGDVASAAAIKAVKYRFAIDKSGNVSMSMSGNVFGHISGSLTVKIDETLTIQGGADGFMTFHDGLTIDGGAFTTIGGKLIRLGAGTAPVARKGDLVTSSALAIPLKIVLTMSSAIVPGVPTPGLLQVLDKIGGVIATGNSDVKA